MERPSVTPMRAISGSSRRAEALPGARSVVFTSNRRGGRYHLWRQPLVDGRPSGPPGQLTDLSGTVNTPAFSADGNWVAFKREWESHREIWVTQVSGGVPERFSDGTGNDLHPAWSPDGTELAYVSERAGETHIWAAPIR